MTIKRFYYPIFGIIIFVGLFGWILPSKAARTWTEFFQQLGGSNHSTTNSSTTRGGIRERTLAEETEHFGKELKMAVVVGINDYPSNSGLRSLRYAKADAEALAQALKQAGYVVQLLTNSNATKGSILNTLSNIGKVLEPQKGTAIFAFAGHGFRDRNGNNYLAPFEASADYIEDTGLSLKKVEATLVASGARRRILLIDACRNDPKPGSRSGATVMDTFTQQPLFQDADGTRILFSTRAGGFSWENPELGHGIFTYFILEGLKGKAANNQGLITFRGLSDYVQTAVPKWAIEKGYAQRPYDAGEGSGWFLVAKNASRESDPQPTKPSSRVNLQLQTEQKRLAALRKQRQAEEARLQQLKRQRQAAVKAARLAEIKRQQEIEKASLTDLTAARHKRVEPVKIEIVDNDGRSFPTYKANSHSGDKRFYNIEARLNAEYSIIVTNQTEQRIGLVIAIDGINILYNTPSNLESTERMYILNPYARQKYIGWRTDPNRIHRFYFTTANNSDANTLGGDKSMMGIIAVAVFALHSPSITRNQERQPMSKYFFKYVLQHN